MTILDAINVAVLCCGMSSHLTSEYEPAGGYNETHESIGLHVEQSGTGWKAGGLYMHFNDSYDKSSNLYAATYMYRNKYSIIEYGAGLGAGYVQTSYYSGVYAAPMVEAGIGNVFLQASFQPKVKGGDAVAAVQLKIRF